MAIVGIDLGTTTSEIAFVKDGKPFIIQNVREGNSTITPSIVLIEKGQVKVGKKAKNQMVLKPKNTAYEIKRHMGTNKIYNFDGEEYTPTIISSYILKRLKEIGEFYLGETITEAVITVPSNFNDIQRRETKKAGELAGLKVERIINEPTAAALAYGINNSNINGFVLVFDFGGGTFDVTLLEIVDGIFDVKCSRGDNSMGGKDIDEGLLNLVVDRFFDDTGVTIDLTNKKVLNQLKKVCEEGKISLSTEESVEIIAPYLCVVDGEVIDLNVEVTREDLENIMETMLTKMASLVDETLKVAKINKSLITKVILVGGSSRIPCVYNMLNKSFSGKIEKGMNPDEVVALGAAVQATIKSGVEKRIILMDNSNNSLGVEVFDGKVDVIISRDSKLPSEKTKGYVTVADNQATVDIRVYQGEGETIGENTCIGYLQVGDIPKKPRGFERVDITFRYDLNGMLKVKAHILSTKKESEIDIDLLNIVTEPNDEINPHKDNKGKNSNKKPYKEDSIDENNNVKISDSVKNNTNKEDLLGFEMGEERKEIVEEIYDDVSLESGINEESLVNNLNNEDSSKEDKSKEVIDNFYEDEEVDEGEVLRDTSQLVSIVNSTINQYTPEGQKILRDKLGDLLGLIKKGEYKEARKIQLEIVGLLDL